MTERIFIVFLFSLIGLGAYVLCCQWQMRRLNQQGGQTAVFSLPTILYFRSDTCPACPTQSRYLEQLTGLWNGRFTLQTVNADLEPEQTAHYRILTLPTTILLDETGQVKHINYGLTNTQKLVKQLTTLSNVKRET